MSLLEKLYNLSANKKSLKLVGIGLVLIIGFILFVSSEASKELNWIFESTLFRIALIFPILFLLYGVSVFMVDTYLNQENAAKRVPSYNKFKKKFMGIAIWFVLFGLGTMFFTNLTVNSSNAKVNRCVKNYGLSVERCKYFYDLGKVNVKQTQTESEARETFVAGCLNSGKSSLSYCSCGFDKIVEKYTYYGYVNLQSDFAKSIYNGKSTNELKSFWQFIQNIPDVCEI